MIFLAKAALGLGATMAVAGAYVFREGVIRVDFDENRRLGMTRSSTFGCPRKRYATWPTAWRTPRLESDGVLQ